MRQEKRSRMSFSSFAFGTKCICLCLLMYLGYFYIKQIPFASWFPIKTVKVYGMRHVDQQEIKAISLPFAQKGFFMVNIVELHDRILQHSPWLSRAIVRRAWPDELNIILIEREPIANWRNEALLTDGGELFVPQSLASHANLPLLIGPAHNQLIILSYFRKINRLLQPLHVKIRQLELTAHATWELTLNNGTVLYVGYKDILTRMSEFVRVYPRLLAERKDAVASVDLRYSNGMAVRWMMDLTRKSESKNEGLLSELNRYIANGKETNTP